LAPLEDELAGLLVLLRTEGHHVDRPEARGAALQLAAAADAGDDLALVVDELQPLGAVMRVAPPEAAADDLDLLHLDLHLEGALGLGQGRSGRGQDLDAAAWPVPLLEATRQAGDALGRHDVAGRVELELENQVAVVLLDAEDLDRPA